MNTYIFQQPAGEVYVPDWLAKFFLYAMGFCLVMLLLAGGVNALLGGPADPMFKADPIKERLIQIETNRFVERMKAQQAKASHDTRLQSQNKEKGNL